PEAVYDDCVQMVCTLRNPARQRPAIKVTSGRRSKVVHSASPLLDPLRPRLPQRDQLDSVTRVIERDGELARGFHAPAHRWIDVARALQNSHGGLRNK